MVFALKALAYLVGLQSEYFDIVREEDLQCESCTSDLQDLRPKQGCAMAGP